MTFERSYGVRTVAAGGNTIAAVSEPNWPQFVRTLGELASASNAQVITTPELMTSADVALADMRTSRTVLQDRVDQAAQLTCAMPGTLLLLGSAAFDGQTERPRNAVLFLQDGEEVGRSYKRSPIGKWERAHFHADVPALAPRKPTANILNIICSDFTETPPIDAAVDTLLVSACWGTPAGYAGVPASPDHKHVDFLRYLARDVLERHDHVETVVMTDRAQPGSQYNGPFNFIARRLSA